MDNTRPLQAALDELARRGGGTLRIGATYRAGRVLVRGSNITIAGDGGTLIDTRLTFAPSARMIRVENLTLLETGGRADSFLIDVSGQDCTFDRLSLIKRPMAGGYQGYVRASAARCTFDRLTVFGSNGVFVAGRGHRFTNFDFTSTLNGRFGGDDAFAIKGAGSETSDILISGGTVRGFSAVVSIGSEVGSSPEHPRPGSVRRVRVSNVTADRCATVCFIKPGALIYDWRDGVVSDVVLEDIRLSDPTGFLFTSGLAITAGRGARISGITSRNIVINARARSQGVMPTAAIDITIRDQGSPALIEKLDLQVRYAGNGAGGGHPVDHLVRVEKDNPGRGVMRNISIDIEGQGSRIGGIYVGGGLDDAVTIRRAVLRAVGGNPPSSVGGGGVWADSRVKLGTLDIQVIKGNRFGGRGIAP